MTDYYTKKGVDQALATKANQSDLATTQSAVASHTNAITTIQAQSTSGAIKKTTDGAFYVPATVNA